MKQTHVHMILFYGMILAVLSPIVGAVILDEDSTQKINALIFTFIPLATGVGMMVYAMRYRGNLE